MSEFGKEPFKAIQAIQANCKFYNYEIWQAHQAAQNVDRPQSQNSDRSATTNPVIYDLRGVMIANLAHEVHGNQITQPEELP